MVDITGLQEMLKLVSLRAETQADMTVHVRGQHGRRDHVAPQTERNGANRAGRHRATVAKYTLSPNFRFSVKLLRGL